MIEANKIRPGSAATMEILKVKSPAKINLTLEVLNKREDGYHNLRTLLQKISIYDTLRFSLKRGKGISVTASHPALPTGKANLVYRAAAAILERSEQKQGIHIDIEKKIPLGAGLGGGSSNAAATLIALNRLLQTDLSRKELMKMGLEIGADVPFFFMEGAAVGTGIGERLKPLDLPVLWYILIYPNFEVSTRWAYEHVVLTKKRFHYKIPEFLRAAGEISSVLRNDLEAVVASHFLEIGMMKEALRSAGALGALMTGSGPTVFGVFSGKEGASEGYPKVKKMVRGKGWMVLQAHSISA
jgi:4-diphosphocytidyl-2-C-methyl-D-erythritol kinase